jgi:hypothetical protein
MLDIESFILRKIGYNTLKANNFKNRKDENHHKTDVNKRIARKGQTTRKGGTQSH